MQLLLCSLFLYVFLSCLFFYRVWSTTVLAVRCADGIIIGSDSMDSSGIFIGNRFSQKIFRVSPLTVVCCASFGSDFSQLCADLRATARRAIAIDGCGLGTRALAHYARQLIHDRYPESHIVLAGCEYISHYRDSFGVNSEVEPDYNIFEILSGGSLVEQRVAVAGSGAGVVATLAEALLEVEDAKEETDSETNKKNTKKKEVDDNTSSYPFSSPSPSRTRSWSRPHPHRSRPWSSLAVPVARVLQAAIRSDSRSGGVPKLWLLSRRTSTRQSNMTNRGGEGLGWRSGTESENENEYGYAIDVRPIEIRNITDNNTIKAPKVTVSAPVIRASAPDTHPVEDLEASANT